MQFSTVALVAATAGSALSAAVYTNGTSTVTDIQTTVITITSCSENKCHETAVTTGLTTVTKNKTVYTTYCPLTTETKPVVKPSSAPAPKPSSAPAPKPVETTSAPAPAKTTVAPSSAPAPSKTTVAATSVPASSAPTVPVANGAAGNAAPVVAAGLLAALQLL